MPALSVRDVFSATPRTRIVRLDLNRTPFSFRAGQAVLVGLADSTLRKPYSIACSPAQAIELDALELLVQIDEPDEPDPHIDRVTPGTLLAVEGPFGTFSLPVTLPERDLLFVAGGTGIAPLRAMLWEALDDDVDRRLTLLYSARSADEFAYEAELRELAALGRIALHQTITRDDAGWTGARGRINAGTIAAALRTPATRCALCGPPAMIAAVTALLKAAGVSEDRVLTETFVG